jgi:transposase InsO family protein
VKLFRFITIQKADFDVVTLCRVCGVSRSAYYAWAKREVGPGERLVDEAHLAHDIYDIWVHSRRRYGVPRITAALRREGRRVNPKKVARLMAELGISGIHGRRKVKTTRRDPSATPAPDLVEREFTAEATDELWVGDVTYIPTDEGWCYVASVLDAYSRRLIGWQMADHLRTELCLDALRAAGAARRRARFAGTVLHTDHGCQYTSQEFRRACRSMGIVQSMGTVGDSYDNAMAESFWASLKRELVEHTHYSTKKGARTAVFEWFMWYNYHRLHSALGYVPPVEFEQSPEREEAA